MSAIAWTVLGAVMASSILTTSAMSAPVAIVGATIIDGTGRTPTPNGVLVMDGGRIKAVGGADTATPANAEQIDAHGKFLIPGLMDANVHLVYGFSTDYLLRFQDRFEDIAIEAAQLALKSGVTTVFDTWGPLEPLKRARDRIAAGEAPGSRIFLAGNIVGLGGPFSDDFYASRASVGADTIHRINAMYEQGVGTALVFQTPDQVRAAMRSYTAKGIDFVKFAISGHGTASNGFLLFSPKVQKAIVEETRRRGMILVSHTTTVESLAAAVDDEVDVMQHCDLTTRELIPDPLVEKIVRSKIACGMQIFPERFLRYTLGPQFSAAPTSIEDPQRRLFAVMMDNRRRLIAAGANVLMSTDGGVEYPGDPLLADVFYRNRYPEMSEDLVSFFGRGHVAWMRGARDAGLTPMQALQAATRNVAAAYRKSEDLGTLEVGKVADMVLLDQDPLDDPAAYGRIVRIFKDGRSVDRERLPVVKVLSDFH